MSTAVAKGYPEFDPDQPRDESGQFSSGGASKPERRSVRPLARRFIEGEEQFVHRKSISEYRDGTAEIVNTALREARERGTSPERTWSTLIQDLDVHIRGHRVTEDVMVYRGVDPDFAAVLEKLNPGDSFTDPGYTSTSAQIGVASNFARGGAIMEIIVPADSNIAPMGPDTGGFEPLSDEKEFLLPRGGVFTYVSRRMDGRLPVYRFEYSPPQMQKGYPEFDPSQPRNEDGTWGAGGGGSPSRVVPWAGGAGKQGPALGKPFVVYRLGSPGEELSGRNAGNAQGVAMHLANADDLERPGSVVGDTITAYVVTVHKPFGRYRELVGGRVWDYSRGGWVAPAGAAPEVGFSYADGRSTFSFPEADASVYSAKPVASISLNDVREKLYDLGFSTFDDSGANKGGQAITLAFAPKLRDVDADVIDFPPDDKVGKGYPEFNPDQPRDAEGQFSSSGGGGRSASLDAVHMSAGGLRVALEDRLPNSKVQVYKEYMDEGGGKLFRIQDGENMATFKIGKLPVSNQSRMYVGLIAADDNPAGARWAQRVMGIIRDMAVASGVDYIEIDAGLDSGGYVWPRLGFDNVDANSMWLRQQINRRIDALGMSGAISEAEAGELYSKVANWTPSVPTQLAKLDKLISLPSDVVQQVVLNVDVRGRQTLGKLLLSGTVGKYRLPRAKFNVLGRISKAFEKGYPEFNPDQPRDEGGRFSGGGAGGSSGAHALDFSSEHALGTSIASRLNPNSIADVHEFGGGWDVRSGDGVNMLSLFIPRDAGKPLTFTQINSADDAGGRQFARNALAVVLDAARQANASAIRLEAAGAGGFVWPFIGFGIDQQDAATPKAAADRWVRTSGIDARVLRATKELSWSQARQLKSILRSGSLDIPAQLARLDSPITREQMLRISGSNGYFTVRPDSKPTMGKALLIGTRGFYSLPKSDWGKLERYITRASKALGKGYPEFDPDQPRDAEGQFSSSGGGAAVPGAKSVYDVRGERWDKLEAALTKQLPGHVVSVSRTPSGIREIYFGTERPSESETGGYRRSERASASFTVTPAGILHADLFEADDTPEGRAAALVIMRAMHRIAVDSGVERIHVESGLSHGNYIWPRLGFDLRSEAEARDFVSTTLWRLDGLLGKTETSGPAIDYGTHRRYETMLEEARKTGDKTIATKIARLNDPVLPGFVPAAGWEVRGRPTVSKYLMSHGSQKYVLTRDKFSVLKALGAGIGKGYPEFNPDQPRDEGGKFSVGSGGAPAAAPAMTGRMVTRLRRGRGTLMDRGTKEDINTWALSGHMINAALRSGDPDAFFSSSDDEDAQLARGMYSEVVASMDEFTHSYATTQAATVWRAIDTDTPEALAVDIHDRGFISTTMDRSTLAGHGSHVMRIELPKGARIGPSFMVEGWAEQAEITLPRGSRLKYTGRDGDVFTYRLLT